MVSIEAFIHKAGSFPEVMEQAHFNKQSFRISKKIFVTLDAVKQQACVKLSPADQDLFSTFNRQIIFAVPNKWGKQGWTFINLQQVPENLLDEILKTAYCTLAPAKLAALVSKDFK